MNIINGIGEQTEEGGDQTGEDKEKHAKVEVLHLQEVAVTSLLKTLIATSAVHLRVEKVAGEAEHPGDQTGHQAPEGARLVDPGPEDGQDVDGADGRRQVGGHPLNVVEELTARLGGLDDGNPEDAQGDQRQHKQPTNDDLLGVAGGRVGFSLSPSSPKVTVDVHGEDGGGAGEDAGQRADERGHHHAHHQSVGADGHHPGDEKGIRQVAALLGAANLLADGLFRAA